MVLRGPKLFDKTTNSFTFTAPLPEVTLVRLLSFDELPPSAQHYITIKASRRFQKRWLGSSEIDGFTKDDEMTALVELESDDLEVADINLVYGNPNTLWALHRG